MQTVQHQSTSRSMRPFSKNISQRCCHSRLVFAKLSDKSIQDITLKNINIMASYMHHCSFLKQKMGFQTSEQGSDNSLWASWF